MNTPDEKRLLVAAQDVLRAHGVAAVSLEAVAAEASVEVSDVEAVFGNLTGLLHELNIFCMAENVAQITAAVSAASGGEHALNAFFRHAVDLQEHRMEEFRLSAHAPQVLPAMMAVRTEATGLRNRGLGNAMFDALEAKLIADFGDDMLPHGVHPRRMAFVAGLMAQGYLNMKGMMKATGQSLLHSDDALVEAMTDVMVAPPRMIQQLTALAEASRELAGMRTEQELIDRVPAMLTDAFDFDRTSLLMDIEGELAMVSVSWPQDDQRALVHELMEQGMFQPPPHLRRCLAEDRTIFVPDPMKEPDWPRLPPDIAARVAQSGWLSPTLFTPLRCDGVPVGLLHAHAHLRWRPLDEQDIARVEAFAAMVGVALQNVRLLENLQGMVDDRTRELRHAQAALVQSEKMASMGQLVSGLAHELNTPVGAVTSAQSSLRRAVDKLGELLPSDIGQKASSYMRVVKDSAQVVETGSQRIDAIVTRLRSFARLDEAAMQQADVTTCIEDALALTDHRLGAGVVIERDFAELPAMRCDPRKLNQLFTNVLANAIDAVGKEGVVRITTHTANAAVEVVIQDDGIGIAAEHLARVFDPGFTTKGVGVGAGLGLSIAHSVAEEHGGHVRIESTLDEGTRVIVVLPLDGASAPDER